MRRQIESSRQRQKRRQSDEHQKPEQEPDSLAEPESEPAGESDTEAVRETETETESESEPEAVSALKDRLLPRATVLTPNLPEAEALLGMTIPETPDGMCAAALDLAGLGPDAVLLKGGHLEGPESPDVFAMPGAIEVLPGARVQTSNTHGTGCTLSAAIAAASRSGVIAT